MTGSVLLTGATGFVGRQVLRALADRGAVVREGKQGELNTLNYRSAKPAEFLCLTFMPERCAGIFISSLTANWMPPMVVPAKPNKRARGHESDLATGDKTQRKSHDGVRSCHGDLD
jgi:hypothetical protein